MSRVHDALRRAESAGAFSGAAATARAERRAAIETGPNLAGLLENVREFNFRPNADNLLIDIERPEEGPVEEFRTLRTRLNHLKTTQNISSMVVTSPSPGEGKSMTAANLALAEASISGNHTLLIDFDFRRPTVHSLFGIDRSPGLTEYLQGKAHLHEVIRKVAGMNLYVAPAGEAVTNPLELLNLRHVRLLLNRLPAMFNWIILDTPPLLFAADANHLSTLANGTLLVVRLGHTTVDSLHRAMNSLCNNNVLGISVNGAREKDLFNKYSYYSGNANHSADGEFEYVKEDHKD